MTTIVAINGSQALSPPPLLAVGAAAPSWPSSPLPPSADLASSAPLPRAALPLSAGLASSVLPLGASAVAAAIKPQRLTLLHVDQRLQDFVCRGDDFGIGVKSLLGRDQVRHFVGQIDIGGFQRAGLKRAEAERSGNTADGRRCDRWAGRSLVVKKIVALA